MAKGGGRSRGRGGKSKGGRSKQREAGGGKFASEQQRKWMWANHPRAARKWAHNLNTNKSDWKG